MGCVRDCFWRQMPTPQASTYSSNPMRRCPTNMRTKEKKKKSEHTFCFYLFLVACEVRGGTGVTSSCLVASSSFFLLPLSSFSFLYFAVCFTHRLRCCSSVGQLDEPANRRDRKER
jgi:hypothetical protein